ncbi:MAG: serine protease [Actinobacteria bacterium]|nr:serine protease [Actinomycetota bacterium]
MPGPKPAHAVGRRRYFHGGAMSMVILSGALAVVVAVVATIVYAQVDAGRKLTGDPNAPPRATPATTATADDGPTTTRLEILSPDELSTKLQASVRAVHTFDDAGQPVEGTAFVVGTAGGQTLLLTSFAVVKAAIREPAPPIVLGESTKATLWTWQEDRDLALLTIGGSVESLPWASAPAKKGDKIFSAAAGQKLSTGVVTGVSDSAIEHNIFTDPARQGAPIVNQRGEVVGMASLVYDPTGKASDTVFIGVPIRASCERVIRCAGGNTVAGDTTTTVGTTTTKP